MTAYVHELEAELAAARLKVAELEETTARFRSFAGHGTWLPLMIVLSSVPSTRNRDREVKATVISEEELLVMVALLKKEDTPGAQALAGVLVGLIE